MKKANVAKKVLLTIAAAGMMLISAKGVSAANLKLNAAVTNETIQVGESEVLTDARILKVSGNADAVKVEENKLTGVKEGAVQVKAIVSGYTRTLNLNVKDEIELDHITASKTSTTLNVGTSETIKVSCYPANTTEDTTATWTTSNTKIATVANGVIKAVGPGTAKVTAKVGNETTITTVTVKAPLQKVGLSKTSASMKTEQTLQLTTALTPANTTDSKKVTWTSSNNSLATVSSTGKVKAIKAGTVKIIAKVGTKTATCTLKIAASAGKYVNTNACYTQLNNYRKAVGLKALAKNSTLEKHAKTRAKELVKKFSHTRPNGTRGLSIIKGNLYKGENIAKGQTSCKQVSQEWYNSAGHRANMLHKQYTKVGIAGFYYNGTYYWVQLFSN